MWQKKDVKNWPAKRLLRGARGERKTTKKKALHKAGRLSVLVFFLEVRRQTNEFIKIGLVFTEGYSVLGRNTAFCPL